jgi:hypothetical protein
MARIVIVRANEYMNRFRSIGLYLNGEHLSDIDNSETLEYEIPAGEYDLVAKIDWCGSQTIKFKVTENEQRIFDLAGFKHNKVILPFSAILVGLHFIMQLFFGIQLSIFFILPLVLLLLFYISIGRNQYLTLGTKEHGEELSAERIG